MYTLYTDKSEYFKCKIGVEGSDISKTRARLVIESENITLLFEGKIDGDGDCVIPIKKLKGILPESDKGNMKLEVITDDTFFSPWEGEYIVKTNKKVTVEVEQKVDKPLIKETKISVVVNNDNENKVITNPGKEIAKILQENDITLVNMDKNVKKVKEIVKEYFLKNKTTIGKENIIDEIIKNLKY